MPNDEEIPFYEGKYCNSDDVLAMVGELSDDATYDLLKVAIDNNEGIIDAELRGNYVPIPTTVPSTLKTVALYLSASDLLLSLNTGGDWVNTFDTWYQKAHELLDAYILEYQRENPDAVNQNSPISHSNAKTYFEKQKDGRWSVVGVWVR